MKTTEMIVCCICLVIVLISTLGEANPAWRPQGRFGKRTHMSALPRMIESDEVFARQTEDIARLCSNPRYAEYPECIRMKTGSSPSLSSESRLKTAKALADYFDV